MANARRRANARNVSFPISVRWSIYIINSVDKPNFRVSLLSVYHAKTWESHKIAIEEDFKSDGLKRVVIATCALGMGVNFPKVKYVVQYVPPTSVVDLMQEAGRGGRDGGQADWVTYYTQFKGIQEPCQVLTGLTYD